MAQMKEQNKSPEKELNETEVTNLSDAELKALVIGTFKELTEYGNNIGEGTKVTLSEIKKNLQGTNSGEDEAENQTNDLEHKEGKSIQSEQQVEKRIKKKNKDRLRNFWDNFKHTNIWIIGMPEGEEEEQEMKNLFEKKHEENFPNLVKEIDIQVQKVLRVQNKLDLRGPHQTHHN